MTDRPDAAGSPGSVTGDARVDDDVGDGPDPSTYAPRIRELAAEAREARESFAVDHGDDPDERALALCREGLGPVVACYLDVRTDERDVALSGEELRLLHRATNDWLDQYARCYGVDLDADFTVREAAELLVKTHNIRDVARLLTQVPARR